MSGHTPGPWIASSKLSGSENHRGFRIMDGANAWALADVQPGDTDGDLGRANALLIAAAPELLAALKEALADLEYLAKARDADYARPDQEIIDAARAAIAKAEGQA